MMIITFRKIEQVLSLTTFDSSSNLGVKMGTSTDLVVGQDVLLDGRSGRTFSFLQSNDGIYNDIYKYLLSYQNRLSFYLL